MQNIPFLEDLITKFGAGNAVVNGSASSLPSMTSPAPIADTPDGRRFLPGLGAMPDYTRDDSQFTREGMGTGVAPAQRPTDYFGGSPNIPVLGMAAADARQAAKPNIPANAVNYFGGATTANVARPPVMMSPPIANQPFRPAIGAIANPQFQPGVSGLPALGAETPPPGPITRISGTGAPSLGTPQTALDADQQEFADLSQKQKTYHQGSWHKKGEETVKTSNPNEVAEHPDQWVMDVAPGTNRKKNWSTWDKIGNALLGWAQGGIVGGIQGATDRNFFRKMQDQRKMAELLPRIQAQQAIAYKNAQTSYEQQRPGIANRAIDATNMSTKQRMAAALLADQRAKKQVEYFTDPNGAVMYRYKNDPSQTAQALKGPDGKPIVEPRWAFTTGGVNVPLAAEPFARLMEQREQQTSQQQLAADTTNATQANETNRANLTAWTAYQGRVQSSLKDIQAQRGTVLKNQADIDGVAHEMETLQGQYEKESARTDDTTESHLNRINDLIKQIATKRGEYFKLMNATGEGKAMLDDLKNQGVEEPQALVPVTVTAPARGGGQSSAVRAQQQLAGMTTQQKDATAKATLDQWRRNNPKATAGQIADAGAKIKATVYGQ